MSYPTDGGPAFPTEDEHQSGPNRWHFQGMSLRDYFAAAAMTGLLSAYGPHAKQDEKGLMISESIFATSFAAADAMLKARGIAK